MEPRPRLAGENRALFSRGERRADDAEGGSVPCGGEAAGVAVGEDAFSIGDELRPETADGTAGGEILLEDPVGFGFQGLERPRRHSGQPLQCPAQIHRCRTRGEQGLPGSFEVVRRKRQTVRRGATDGRRASHDHLADRFRHFRRAAGGHDFGPRRQRTLIEQVQRAILEPERTEAH